MSALKQFRGRWKEWVPCVKDQCEGEINFRVRRKTCRYLCPRVLAGQDAWGVRRGGHLSFGLAGKVVVVPRNVSGSRSEQNVFLNVR